MSRRIDAGPCCDQFAAFSVVDALRKNLSRPQRRCDVKRLVILVKRKLSENEPAKTNFDAWRAAQPALLGKVLTKLLKF